MSELFYKLPQDIAARKDLRASDKIVFAVIVDCLGKNDKCWPGKLTLMQKTGLSGQTVCDAIGRLETAGVLQVDRRGKGKSNHYQTSPEIRPESSPESRPVQKVDQSKNQTTTSPESRPEVVQKLDTNQTKTNQTNVVNTSFAFALKSGNFWTLPQAKFDEYQKTYPKMDIEFQFRKAAQWLLDHPTKKKTARGMPAFLGGWLGRNKTDAVGPEYATHECTEEEAELLAAECY